MRGDNFLQLLRSHGRGETGLASLESLTKECPHPEPGQVCFTFWLWRAVSYSRYTTSIEGANGVPTDFPRIPPLASLAGAQPKLAARRIDAEYWVGLTPEELQVRFELCQDLVEQLVPYCRKKRAEQPQWPLEHLLEKVSSAFCRKGWDLSKPELL